MVESGIQNYLKSNNINNLNLKPVVVSIDEKQEVTDTEIRRVKKIRFDVINDPKHLLTVEDQGLILLTPTPDMDSEKINTFVKVVSTDRKNIKKQKMIYIGEERFVYVNKKAIKNPDQELIIITDIPEELETNTTS